MTQEEKAKAYDEAFKRAKDCHTDGLSLHQPVRDVIEHIFPELKESENERIRRELICFLETEIPQCNARDKYIDWLEKLGEKADPNMSNNNDDDIDICDTCKDGQHCSKSNYVKSHCWRREYL